MDNALMVPTTLHIGTTALQRKDTATMSSGSSMVVATCGQCLELSSKLESLFGFSIVRSLDDCHRYRLIKSGWLSPELYLRRPPSKNEQYRLDRMLGAAAQRGVKVNIIVYKEVAQALTRKYLSPTLPKYLHSLLPHTTDSVTSALTRLGLAVTFKSLEYVETGNPLISPPLTVNSNHTKHALEDLHQNISVFRHPDHLPDAQTVQSSLLSSLKNLSLNAATASKLPGDTLKALYGMNEDVILFWAHHEKLCVVDGRVGFMGGLDLCYGRWDTNQHSIADAHPGDLQKIVFPGQDFNNARIMDFADVDHWENNKLDRKESSRMGWSDISLSLSGPVLEDLKAHFVERWNFIYDEKYNVRKDARYSKLTTTMNEQPQGEQPHGLSRFKEEARDRMENRIHHVEDEYLGGSARFHGGSPPSRGQRSYSSERQAGMRCQIARSSSRWSHGIATEHSIANAYIDVIQNSQHFVYIENQFFITATSDAQKPIKNKIGAAIVERILRAARAGEKYKVIVVMPAIPAFAGDLMDEASLGTRAIMEFQYNSINRGGHSIMESIGNAGFNPMDYIRFYNLRNYDRINVSASMLEAEKQSGVDYELARREHDDMVDPVGYRSQGGAGNANESSTGQNYQRYQQAASNIDNRGGLGNSRWDSVSECYMLGGPDIRDVPWENGDVPEIDAFVTEELYVHSKVLIADDRVVICGSANLNDRSQLGYHDSEIAIIIQDPTPLDSQMNGQPWQASKFAATLRRQLFRKHIGLLPPQDIEQPNQNFEPIGVPNIYDFGSAEDQVVEDPLSDHFLNFWNGRAKQNTDAFGRVFHPVPHDAVQTTKDYDSFYECFFQGEKDPGKKGARKPPKYKWGHVVADQFSPVRKGFER